MTPLDLVRQRLEAHGCRPRGSERRFTARCPAHDDGSPSLSVREGRDGRVLLKCFAGCPTENVLRELGLAWTDLFADGGRRR